MMLEYLGAALIFAASSGFGLIYIRSKKRRLEALRSICGALELMLGELGTRATPLPELSLLLGRRAKGAASAFFQNLSVQLPRLGQADFAELWQEAAERELISLSRTELDEVCGLGDILGRYELEEQFGALRSCISALRTSLEEAQRAYPGEKKLGLGLTAAAGVLLIVILL